MIEAAEKDTFCKSKIAELEKFKKEAELTMTQLVDRLKNSVPLPE